MSKQETLKIMVDPYLITQNYGKIPFAKIPVIIDAENVTLQEKIKSKDYDPELKTDTYPIKMEDVIFSQGHTCSAASIEFNLADRNPAEFVRYIEGLTSPQKSVKTKIKYSDLSENMMEALGALVEQNTDFKTFDWKNIEVTIKPDENAYLRADAQEDARVKNSRSMIDVLMQSAFMQLGSRATYNSLTDRRSKDTGNGMGLNQFEIAFTESIVDSNSRKIPIVYMELDDEVTKILKYNYDFETTKKHFINSLNKNKNIIVGFLINMDNNRNILSPDGHEILLTGYKYNQNNKLLFKYNDTDDGNNFAPSWIEADKLIPAVHHANIPENVLKEKIPQYDIGYLYLQDYHTLKQQK